MNFQPGTIKQAVQTEQLKQKWLQKLKQAEENPFTEQLRKINDERKMSYIKSLLHTGKYLTREEKEYLRQNDPVLYHQAVTVEKERENYKRALERCCTKEDAKMLNCLTSNMLAYEASHTIKSPIPAEAKQSRMEFIGFREAALSKTFTEFLFSGKYSRLPSSVELKLARIARAEAEELERARRKHAEKAMREQDCARRERIKKALKEREHARRENARLEHEVLKRKTEQKIQEMKELNRIGPPSPDIDYDIPLAPDNFKCVEYTQAAQKEVEIEFELKKGKTVSHLA